MSNRKKMSEKIAKEAISNARINKAITTLNNELCRSLGIRMTMIRDDQTESSEFKALCVHIKEIEESILFLLSLKV